MTSNLSALSDIVGRAEQCEWPCTKMARAWAHMFIQDNPNMDAETMQDWFSIIIFLIHEGNRHERQE